MSKELRRIFERAGREYESDDILRAGAEWCRDQLRAQRFTRGELDAVVELVESLASSLETLDPENIRAMSTVLGYVKPLTQGAALLRDELDERAASTNGTEAQAAAPKPN